MTTRTLNRLMATPAAAGTGKLVAPTTPGASDGIWLVVELALPKVNPPIFGLSAYYGVGMLYDEALNWVDVTDWFRGGDWHRGGETQGERWRVGHASFEFANDDDAFSRWSGKAPAFTGCATTARDWFGTGAHIRIGLRILDAGDYEPLFTGIVDDWSERSPAGANLNRHVVITADETTTTIANAPGSAVELVGDGETIIERAGRILDAAEWLYPRDLAPADPTASLYGTGVMFGSGATYSTGLPALAATDLSAVRLAELYTAAEASWCWFHAGRDGSAKLTFRSMPKDASLATDLLDDGATDTGSPTDQVRLGYDTAALVPYLPGLELVVEVDAATRNDITLARPGGEDQHVVDVASRERVGKREHVDRTVPLSTDTGVLTLATTMLAAQAWPKLRVRPIQVDSKAAGLTNLLTMIARRDLGDQLPIWWKPGVERLRIWTRINGERHQVTAGRAGETLALWRTTYELDNHDPAPGQLAGGFDVLLPLLEL